jgi:uracil-DNA glycosylase family 4
MGSDLPSRAELVSILDWYRAAGVTEPLSEKAPDRLAAAPAAAASRPEPASPSVASAGTTRNRGAADAPRAAASGDGAGLQPDAGTIEAARQLAAAAADLASLEKALDGFDGCPLKLRATRLCFADGNPEGDVMFIGEAPGQHEDAQGKPFVGRAGQLLDRILGAIGLDRTKVYIANTVPWRPPGNRTPTPAELAVCRPFLERQVELAAPKIVVPLGGAAAKHLFDTDTGIMRLRGQWRELTIGAHSCQAMATLHPAYLLRQPAQKKLVWRDMLELKARLGA